MSYWLLILFFKLHTISVENQSSVWGDISDQLTKQQQCSLDWTLAWSSEDLVVDCHQPRHIKQLWRSPFTSLFTESLHIWHGFSKLL